MEPKEKKTASFKNRLSVLLGAIKYLFRPNNVFFKTPTVVEISNSGTATLSYYLLDPIEQRWVQHNVVYDGQHKPMAYKNGVLIT